MGWFYSPLARDGAFLDFRAQVVFESDRHRLHTIAARWLTASPRGPDLRGGKMIEIYTQFACGPLNRSEGQGQEARARPQIFDVTQDPNGSWHWAAQVRRSRSIPPQGSTGRALIPVEWTLWTKISPNKIAGR
jgi:hypothetical protein